MRQTIKIEKEPFTDEDYARAEKYGGFSDAPIPVSEESRRWFNEFWDVIKTQNMLANQKERQSISA